MSNGTEKVGPQKEGVGEEVEIKDSAIEGRGVFATRDFHIGETVFVWDTSHEVNENAVKTLPAEDARYLTRHNGKYFLMPEPMRYMNHSCEANTRPENGKDVATREIKAGEEITSDYRPQLLKGERLVCSCGTLSCQGFIIGIAD
ncbi:SET domain-containing protein [Candidatus Kaiserbacteria bacterium]|nr:SET domain-containing protein [Candidatus Kaiserbacteria bacterium]